MTQRLVFGEGIPPQSIGVVGVSTTGGSGTLSATGLITFRLLRDSGFKGRLYPINPKGKELDGVEVYPSVTSVPERLDLAIVIVPAAAIPNVLQDCVAAKVRNVQINTSGFAETGEEEGKRLEDIMREVALKGGLRVIGPNCMGLHIPSANMKMFASLELVQGPVAYISQSGGHAWHYLRYGPDLGIGFSAAISYGNALTVDATELLEYFASDAETGIICMYLEGIKDGRRFTELVREVNPVKPVIIWKGGLTEAGARAASSHTASLGGTRQVWDAFFKQTHAIQVDSIEEMAEVTMTRLRMRALPGARMAVRTGGGGTSVNIADTCNKEGVDLPTLSLKTRKRLMEFLPLVNQSVLNPLDAAEALLRRSPLRQTIEILVDEPLVDVIVLVVNLAPLTDNIGITAISLQNKIADTVGSYHRENPNGKPVVVTTSAPGHLNPTIDHEFIREMRASGLTAYNSLRGTCRALKRYSDYCRYVAETAK